MSDVAADKHLLRAQLRRVAAEKASELQTDNEWQKRAEQAAAILISLSRWKQAQSVLLFSALADELSTQPVLDLAFQEKKRVCFPRVLGAALGFVSVTSSPHSANGEWETGPWGILEPAAQLPEADVGTLPGPLLVLVPGMAFDISGHRLGRGKGFYDRFLRSIKELRQDVCALGWAYDYQVLASVPVSEHDEILDALCTESRCLHYGE